MKANLLVLLISAVVVGFILLYMKYRSANPTPNNIVFMKYPGANLCFATVSWGTNMQTMATVPCGDVPEGKLHTFEGQ
jgi:hypothetical protein